MGTATPERFGGPSLTYLAPTGNLGAGFTESHFVAALEKDLAFIGCDAGSCDGGPSYLGANNFFNSRQSVKRDLAIMLRGARAKRIPLLIGSAGGSGGNWNVDWLYDILTEIAREEGLAPFNTARIYAEIDQAFLVERWQAGALLPLDAAPPIDEDRLRNAVRVVGMMGADAFQAALDGDADVVIAGRATDASIFAAIPLARGFVPGLAWHAAKIMECGGAAVAKMDRPEGMLCTLDEEGFTLEPVSPHQHCTPGSVAAHALYETGNPLEMREPSGTLLLQDAKYEAVDERRVRVTNSGFRHEDLTIRLEGAELVGYRAIVIGGVRDPMILRQFDAFMNEAQRDVRFGIESVYGASITETSQIDYHVYGRDAVLGDREPERDRIGHEVGIMISAVADTQELANAIAALAGHRILHHAVPEWKGLVSNLAFPLTPFVISVGPAYRFMLNHALVVNDPLELFSIRYDEVSA